MNNNNYFTKKFIAVILTLSILLSYSSNAVLSYSVYQEADFSYELIDGGLNVSIIRYTGALKEIAVPDTIDGKPVTNICDYAFTNGNNITSVNIGKNVKSFGSFAFLAGYLISINIDIENSIYSSIDGVVFSKDLAKIITFPVGKRGAYTIPNGVTSIGNFAFYHTNLTSIDISNSVTSIGNSAFFNGNGIKSINIPNSVIIIGDSAFANCSAITSINIPKSVTIIADAAFRGCIGLTHIDIDIENNVYSSVDGVVYNKYLTTIVIFPSGKTGSYTIPNGITIIDNFAFYGCNGLTNIYIPNSVNSIGNSAFFGCSGLNNIDLPNNLTYIGAYAFNGCSGKADFILPNSFTSIGDNTFYGFTGLTSITIPNSVTSIGDSAFSSCMGLTNVNIPNSVTSIGDSAFSSCVGLTNVNIPNSVTSIGDSAFSYCNGLTNINIPESITSISNAAFKNCYNLTKATFLGNAPSYFGDSVFDGSKKYFAILFYEGMTGFSAPSWKGYFSKMLILSIKSEVKYLPKYVFSDGKVTHLFSKELAQVALNLSWNTYNKPDEGTGTYLEELTKEGFKDAGVADDTGIDQNVFCSTTAIYGIKPITVGNKKKYVVAISFRGTSGIADMLTDANVNITDPQGFHHGFHKSAMAFYNVQSNIYFPSVSKNLSEIIQDAKSEDSDYYLFISGHSLGGAIANIYASVFLQDNGVNPRNMYAYTFGTPKSAGYNYANVIDARFMFNIINSDDPVTTVAKESRIGKDLIYTLSDNQRQDLYGLIYIPGYSSGTYSYFNVFDFGLTLQRIDVAHSPKLTYQTVLNSLCANIDNYYKYNIVNDSFTVSSGMNITLTDKTYNNFANVLKIG